MKYALLIYQPFPFDPKALPAEEHAAIGAAYGAISARPDVTPGLPLGLPAKAMTVRVADGETHATPGPFISPAGAVGGYMILEADTMEDAIALAAQIPAARLGGAIEVRACEVYW
jgi:hypothetical protein